METVFFFNCGRFAYGDGVQRIAPETVEYPVMGWGDDRHKLIRKETIKLTDWEKGLWLQGYDHRAKAVAEKAKPKAKLTWIKNHRTW